MNTIFIIGNLTRDPELRTTQTGHDVCTFTVAVNRRNDDAQGADFFRVSAWRGLAATCSKYLAKGRKVAVVGSITLNTYEANGKTYSSLEVNASNVEFLCPKGNGSLLETQSLVRRGSSLPMRNCRSNLNNYAWCADARRHCYRSNT